MKRKIFISMCILALITILFTSLMISAVMYKEFYDKMKLEVINEASYIAAALNSGKEDFLSTVKNASNRVTLIRSDGSVLYDSEKDAEQMENHIGRPEVADAFSKGSGEAVRTSSTLGSRTYYHAVRLSDGTVLRIASDVGGVFSTLKSTIPYLVLVVLVTFAIALLFAKEQTRKIVTPINSIDLENPMYNDVYDELAPLLTRMNKQNLLIESTMQEVRQKQEELTTITQNMQDGLVVLDAKSTVLYINRSAMRIFDVRSGDVLHKNILALQRNLSLQRAVEKAAAGGSSEEDLIVGDKHYRVIANAVWVDGAVRGVSLLILDVTERHAAEHIRREFAANVSHELKTPLTVISGYAEIMKDGLVKSEDLHRFSERIFNEASRMITLVQDIIKLSRLDEGIVDIPREEVDLLAAAQEVCTRLQPQADNKGISLSVSGSPAIINGVRQILEEMIFNLCDNAIKYNRENGKVQISVTRNEAGDAVLSVADTGIGIPKDHQERVFERFYRVDKSHSKETGGTGLGLSIVKHGAQYHNAKVELKSEPGKGTTVKLIFGTAGF